MSIFGSYTGYGILRERERGGSIFERAEGLGSFSSDFDSCKDRCARAVGQDRQWLAANCVWGAGPEQILSGCPEYLACLAACMAGYPPAEVNEALRKAGMPAIAKQTEISPEVEVDDGGSGAYPWGVVSADTRALQQRINQILPKLGRCTIGTDGKLGPGTCGAARYIYEQGGAETVPVPSSCQDYRTPAACPGGGGRTTTKKGEEVLEASTESGGGALWVLAGAAIAGGTAYLVLKKKKGMRKNRRRRSAWASTRLARR